MKMRTVVLFVSHIVNEETVYRYNLLKAGCLEMGYDLFWAMDADSKFKNNVPSETPKFQFSYAEYEKEFPNQVFFYKRKYNMTPSVPNLFYLHNRGKYDYIWVVEYDVCCYGKWSKFFRYHDESDADLISSKEQFFTYEQLPNWYFFRKWMSPILRKRLADEGVLCKGLMCCSRLSAQMIEDIWNFHKNLKSRLTFFEWTWPTVARMNNRKHVLFDSSWFKFKPGPPDWFEYKDGELYHPIKEHIHWNEILNGGKWSCSEQAKT